MVELQLGRDELVVDHDLHPVPHLELPDQCKSVLTLHGAEAPLRQRCKAPPQVLAVA